MRSLYSRIHSRVSIHAPREGCDRSSTSRPSANQRFQFTHPGRGATYLQGDELYPWEFQFTHPGRGATRTPCRRPSRKAPFQFTHPGRGATPKRVRERGQTWGFNSRTPGGVRHLLSPTISIKYYCFNSRTPGGVRQHQPLCKGAAHQVSIHAPREGCDRRYLSETTNLLSFNSRTPGGVRLTRISVQRAISRFNSRTPGGVRLTLIRCNYYATYCFNSRTPGGVRLAVIGGVVEFVVGFNSRTPGGVRPAGKTVKVKVEAFQFTHPGRGATRTALSSSSWRGCFNSRTPGGVRLKIK